MRLLLATLLLVAATPGYAAAARMVDIVTPTAVDEYLHSSVYAGNSIIGAGDTGIYGYNAVTERVLLYKWLDTSGTVWTADALTTTGTWLADFAHRSSPSNGSQASTQLTPYFLSDARAAFWATGEKRAYVLRWTAGFGHTTDTQFPSSGQRYAGTWNTSVLEQRTLTSPMGSLPGISNRWAEERTNGNNQWTNGITTGGSDSPVPLNDSRAQRQQERGMVLLIMEKVGTAMEVEGVTMVQNHPGGLIKSIIPRQGMNYRSTAPYGLDFNIQTSAGWSPEVLTWNGSTWTASDDPAWLVPEQIWTAGSSMILGGMTKDPTWMGYIESTIDGVTASTDPADWLAVMDTAPYVEELEAEGLADDYVEPWYSDPPPPEYTGGVISTASVDATLTIPAWMDFIGIGDALEWLKDQMTSLGNSITGLFRPVGLFTEFLGSGA